MPWSSVLAIYMDNTGKRNVTIVFELRGPNHVCPGGVRLHMWLNQP